MKIAIVGTRGIPAKYGGFETFAEEIAPRLVKSGYEVAVQCDCGSYDAESINGVDLFFSKVNKSQHPLFYYFEGLRWACKNADLILVVTTFGSIFYPLKYFYGKPVITNTDGIESRRAKWSPLHKLYIKISEFFAVLFSDYLIADSESIRRYLKARYPYRNLKVEVIEYGAPVYNSLTDKYLENYNIRPDEYYIVVCRIEPENNIDMVIEGFLLSATRKKLLIIGDYDISQYSRNLFDKFRNNEQIIFLGALYQRDILNSLRFWSYAYLHGHSVGGTNPSLLESMGCGSITICHDNEFNREVTNNKQFYFKKFEELAEVIKTIELLDYDQKLDLKTLNKARISEHYSWNQIVEKYIGLTKQFAQS